MEYQDLENIRRHSGQVIKKICAKYGLHGNVIYYAPSPIHDSDRNKLYIVAGPNPAIGQDPPPAWLHPDEIVRRNERNKKLFHPDVWAFDLFENSNDMQAQQELAEYCKKAEFITRLYQDQGLAPPKKIRHSEISQLLDYYSVLENPAVTDGIRTKCEDAVNWFFKREKSQSRFRQRWLDYYRSERFPDGKGPIAKLRGYFQRDNILIDMDRLNTVNDSIHKLTMQEHEYKVFCKFMKDCYPDVSFAAGDVEVVNHGLINVPGETDSTFGRAVTSEEFAVIRKERFADEGYEALANLRPAYWEFRDVFYKAVDESLIASAYNSVTLSYAKCDPLMELKERGEIALERIPVNDFMNFVSLAKTNKLRFYIDNLGDFATPSLEFVNVIYNKSQNSIFTGIKGRMVGDKADSSHISCFNHPSLNSVIDSAERFPYETINKRLTHSNEAR